MSVCHLHCLQCDNMPVMYLSAVLQGRLKDHPGICQCSECFHAATWSRRSKHVTWTATSAQSLHNTVLGHGKRCQAERRHCPASAHSAEARSCAGNVAQALSFPPCIAMLGTQRQLFNKPHPVSIKWRFGPNSMASVSSLMRQLHCAILQLAAESLSS